MRKIKFRGKHVDNGSWVYGYYYAECDVTYIIEDRQKDSILNRNLIHVVDSNTVSQYTGLNDINGVEIYSDDILYDGSTKFRVYAVKGGFGIKATYWATNINNLVLGDELILMPLSETQTASWIGSHCEVIGNIYQNSELFE